MITESRYKKLIEGKKIVGDPSGQFIIPRGRMDRLLAEAGGDIDVVKETLGIPAHTWNEPMRRVDINNPLLHNARLPSGLERGANEFFRWGGYTNRGLPEAVISQAPVADTTVSGLLFTK